MVVAEALACGTLVIVSPGGASRLFLGQAPLQRLLISDPYSVEKFRSAILEVLSEPAFFRQVVLERIVKSCLFPRKRKLLQQTPGKST